MPSHLRLQSSIEEPISANAIYQSSPTLSPPKKRKMSITQSYYIASSARAKLGKEAGRADHNLRLLVGHANLLDQLMVDLADAEREQEAWFNQSVKKASKPEEPKHVQWIDTIPEDEESDSDDESDDGSIYDEDEYEGLTLKKLRSPPVTVASRELEEDLEDMDAEYEDDEAEEDLTLTRVPSHVHSPPALVDDDTSDSEDEQDSMPPSPETEAMEIDDKQRVAIATTSFYGKSGQTIEDYIMQRAQQPSQPMIAAC